MAKTKYDFNSSIKIRKDPFEQSEITSMVVFNVKCKDMYVWDGNPMDGLIFSNQLVEILKTITCLDDMHFIICEGINGTKVSLNHQTR